ncbi:MAG TPA: hypothetical protein VFJ14_01770 [Nocardioidaceae bacterium]|nr:hypothetical protein [Nocardioidaceae bacterium]
MSAEQTPDPRPTECGFCEGGRLTVRTTSFAALLAGGDGREVPCPYCHGTGLAP